MRREYESKNIGTEMEPNSKNFSVVDDDIHSNVERNLFSFQFANAGRPTTFGVSTFIAHGASRTAKVSSFRSSALKPEYIFPEVHYSLLKYSERYCCSVFMLSVHHINFRFCAFTR